MSAIWPEKLDCLTLDYGIAVQPPVKGDNSDAGNLTQRERFKSYSDVASVRYVFTSELDFKTFTFFHQFMINNGADRFIAPYYDGRGRVEGEVQMIGGVYNANPLSEGCWEVTFNLRITNRSHEDENDALLCAMNVPFLTCDIIDCVSDAVGRLNCA